MTVIRFSAIKPDLSVKPDYWHVKRHRYFDCLKNYCYSNNYKNFLNEYMKERVCLPATGNSFQKTGSGDFMSVSDTKKAGLSGFFSSINGHCKVGGTVFVAIGEHIFCKALISLTASSTLSGASILAASLISTS